MGPRSTSGFFHFAGPCSAVVGIASERGRGKRLAALPCMKTHKDTAAHAGKGETGCQPWVRLTNRAAFDQWFFISLGCARRSQA
jgi:hypothetical protein